MPGVAYSKSYTYDAVGNRLTKTDNLTSETTTSTYDAANQLETSVNNSGTTSYTYDANGNLTEIEDPSNNITKYTWDEENRCTKFELPSPSTEVVTSTYNGNGLRVKREDSAETKKFIWDLNDYLMELDVNDECQLIYTQRPSATRDFGRLISQRRKEVVGWSTDQFHFDALGSTVNLTDSNEDVEETYVYDAFGNVLSSNTLHPAFLYVGEQGYFANWLDSQLVDYYIRDRIYNQTNARWLSVDRLGLVSNPNQYLYVDNSPVDATDPSGLYKTFNGAVGCWGEPQGLEYVTNRGDFSARSNFLQQLAFAPGGTRVGLDAQVMWLPNKPNFTQNRNRVYANGKWGWQNKRGCCCCKRIGFIQIVKQDADLANKIDENFDWRFDGTSRLEDNLRELRYRHSDTLNPCAGAGTSITLTDQPGTDIYRSAWPPFLRVYPNTFRQKFESCAVCISGTEATNASFPNPVPPNAGGRIAGLTTYGCLSWSIYAVKTKASPTKTSDYTFFVAMGNWKSVMLTNFNNPRGAYLQLDYSAFSRELRRTPGLITAIPSISNGPASMPPSSNFENAVTQHRSGSFFLEGGGP